MDKDRLNKIAWGAALSTWVIGDIATTAYGLSDPNVIEANPTSKQVVDAAGYTGMLASKLIVTGAFAGFQELAPDEYDIGVPIGLATVGTVVTANNISVIMRAGELAAQ